MSDEATFRAAAEIALAVGRTLADVEATGKAVASSPFARYASRGIGGSAGLAMLYAHLIESNDRLEFRTALGAYMKDSAQGDTRYGCSLFNGIAGVLAACNSALGVEPRYRPLAVRCCEVIAKENVRYGILKKVPAAGWHSYDLISGVSGQAIALSIADQTAAFPSCNYLAWMLEDNARWSCEHPLRPGPARNDLGLAHGLAGMVAALSIASRNFPRFDREIRLAADKLVAVRNPYSLFWPSGAGESGGSYRQAWCYGTPSCAAALALVSARLGDTEYLSVAVESLERLAESSIHDWQLSDDAICHGIAGNALVFHSLARMSGSATLSDVAQTLISRLISDYDEGTSFGYLANYDHGTFDAPGMLTGSAGTALTLLSTAGLCDTTWMLYFGIPPF